MDIKQMDYFLHMCDCGSLPLAAERLYVTPQALGKVLRNLEAEVGAKLLSRDKRRLRPTPCGEVFCQHARQVLAAHGDMQAALAIAARHQRGNVRLALSHGVLHALGPDVFTGFCGAHPEVFLDILELPDLLAEEYVRRGECDVGFSIGVPMAGDACAARLLSQNRICAVVKTGHPLAGREQLCVEDLRGWPVVTKNENYRIYHTLEACAQKSGVALSYALRSPDEILWQRMVREGEGVGIGVSFLAGRSAAAGLACIPFAETEMAWDVYLFYHKSQPPGEAGLLFYNSLAGAQETAAPGGAAKGQAI